MNRRTFVGSASLGALGLALGAPGALARQATPAASPVAISGLQMVFVSSKSFGQSGTELYVADTDGSNVTEIVSVLDHYFDHPDWSPDGSLIVFEERTTGNLFTCRPDGSEFKLLLENPSVKTSLQFPHWSPDGTKISFMRMEWNNPEDDIPTGEVIQILDIASGEITDVIRMDTPMEVDWGRWSPDGTQLVVSYGENDENFSFISTGIGLVPVAGGELTPLAADKPFAIYPDWSWANDTIVFGIDVMFYIVGPTEDVDSWDIFTIKPDGSGLKQVTHLDAGQLLTKPSWSGDGKWIIATLGMFPDVHPVLIDPETGDIHPTITTDMQTSSRLRP